MRGPSSFAIGGALGASFLPCGFACADCFGWGAAFCSDFAFESCFWSLSLAMLCLDLLAVTLEHPHLAAVFQRLHERAIGLLRGGVEERDVRDVDRQVFVDDAALLALHGIRPLVLLHAVHALDHHMLGVDAAQHRAALALVAPRQYDHFVTLADFVHQSTSGASDTIFMNCSVRSSRVTGPKMRVPIGSSLLVSSTAALPSNLISEPSGRRTPRRVRTTTAS